MMRYGAVSANGFETLGSRRRLSFRASSICMMRGEIGG
jgi:hypothetical protein